MGDITPPPLQSPTSKEKKYDRQLRLWAASGQVALEESHILLINSGTGTVGVEALKNLVLPGIGQFTILDSEIVEEADLGVNFFLDEQSLGGFRAEHCCRLLEELNPDVKGHFITEPLETFVQKPDALRPFSHVALTAPVAPAVLKVVSEYTWQHQIPLFYIHCVGFYAHFSIALPSTFPIVDTHPEPETTSDLRLLAPWPALVDYMDEKTGMLDGESDDVHGHVPYLLLLLHFLEEWKATHDGKVPQNYSEKVAFRSLVASHTRRNNPEGGEENFDEAVAAVLKSLNPPEARSAAKDVFKAPECQNLTAQSSNFWVIAHAIHLFYQKHGVLPLPGAVPDMKAKSEDYIQLQNIYKTKARQDTAEVLDTVRSLEQQLGRKLLIAESEVQAFCKGSNYIHLIHGRPLPVLEAGQMRDWGRRAKYARNQLTDPESTILTYIAFLAWDSFTASHSKTGSIEAPEAPGDVSNEADLEKDANKLVGITEKIIDDLIHQSDMGPMDDPEYTEVKERAEQIARELARASGRELHNIASLAGGVIAEEMIKVITKQYVPVDNTCIIDGVTSRIGVLKL